MLERNNSDVFIYFRAEALKISMKAGRRRQEGQSWVRLFLNKWGFSSALTYK